MKCSKFNTMLLLLDLLLCFHSFLVLVHYDQDLHEITPSHLQYIQQHGVGGPVTFRKMNTE